MERDILVCKAIIYVYLALQIFFCSLFQCHCTQAWDTFMSLVATTRLLGISFFDYVRDRISQLGIIPSLSTIIREKSSLYPLGLSWQLD